MTGRVAIVTGGSRGIGAGLVAAYRSQGWAVVASDRAIEASDDANLLTVAADITERATAERIIEAALGHFGRIDTLVNSAGVVISKPFTDYTAADYASVVGDTLARFFWLTQRAIDEMASRYGGHVVSITATVAEYANSGTPGVLAALAEDGLAAATKSLAIECACYGIRVNAVSPGISAAASHDDLGGWPPPLGWPGQVSDVIDGVLLLESSRYITGEILHVGGGQAEGR